MIFIAEDGGSDRCEDMFFPLGGFPRDDPVSLDEKTVVDDVVDMVSLSEYFGAKRFARTAFADKSIYFRSLKLPKCVFKNTIHSFHYTEIPVQ
jgi:hypothetical protein